MAVIKSIEDFNNIHLDVLKEIGNIGSGHAITALSKLLNKKINMAVPKVQMVDFKTSADILGGADNIVVGILLNITGDIDGYIMFVFEQKHAQILVNILMNRNIHEQKVFNEMDISVLNEIGNILAGSYLSSLCTLTGLNIIPSTPDLTIDMAGAILSVPAIEFSKTGDVVLFIETEFNQSDHTVIGNFFLMPDIKSYDILLKSLGVD